MSSAGDGTQQQRSMSPGRELLFLGALAALGLFLLGMAFFRVQDTIHDQQRLYMRSVARTTASSIGNFIEGYLSTAAVVAGLPHFRIMAVALRNGGAAGPVLDYLRTMTTMDEFPAIADAFVIDDVGSMLAGSAFPGDYVPVPGHEIRPNAGALGAYRNGAGKLFLGFSVNVSDGLHLFLLVDADMMYKSTASFVMLGEKGYVMLKHSSGLILTHPEEEQVGGDVLAWRKERFPYLDFADLEELVAEQRRGAEGIRVYYSYWWRGGSPQPARKMSAFVSVPVQRDFIIVSAVNDYAELREPILYNYAQGVAAAILITLGVGGMLLSRRRENQIQIERENAYLKELNRRAEETRHNQRLQMIGTLAGGIAHEFRNLLTPIMGYSGILRDGLPADSPLREDLDEIYSCALRAKEIIQQITSLTRKKLEPTLTPIGLDEIVSGAVKTAAAVKPVGVKLEAAVDFAGRKVMGSVVQINQILLNLFNNAFQAMPAGGVLTVTGEVTPAGGKGGEEGGAATEWAVLTVRDSGVGIGPEVIGRIFDPFFTTKPVGEGTGLGLAVVQNLVDIHGGSISVVSEPGAGAAFRLSLPMLGEE